MAKSGDFTSVRFSFASCGMMSVMAMLHQLTFQIDKQTSEGIYVINIYVINKCELRPRIEKGKC